MFCCFFSCLDNLVLIFSWSALITVKHILDYVTWVPLRLMSISELGAKCNSSRFIKKGNITLSVPVEKQVRGYKDL